MELKARLLNYITNHYPINDTKLMTIATSKGYTEPEVYQALEEVGRDKGINTRLKGDTIWYEVATIPVARPQTHLEWCRDNYVRPHFCKHKMEYTSCTMCQPFPEIDFSYLFLKPDEMKEFKAQMKGGWGAVRKSKHANTRR